MASRAIPVRVEAGGRGEPFVADVADVRLLSRVRASVALQKARTVEALAAYLKGE